MTEQSRANDSSNWRRRDDSTAASPNPSTNWSKPQRDNRNLRNDANGRYTTGHVGKTPNVDTNGDDVDYNKRIYLGNLLYFATEDDVKSLLEGFDYLKVVISIDPMTGRNPSYCFVDFATEEEAQRGLVELNGLTILKRPVKTRPATKPREGPKKYELTRPPQAEWKEPPQDRQQAWVFNRWQRDPAEARTHNVPPSGCRLWVGSLPSFNLDPVHVQTNVRAFFENQGFTPTAISKTIPPAPEHKRQDGRDHYCFVDFSTKEESIKAAEAMNDVTPPWGGRPVKVRIGGVKANSSWKVNQRKDYMKQHGLESAVDRGSEPELVALSKVTRDPFVQLD